MVAGDADTGGYEIAFRGFGAEYGTFRRGPDVKEAVEPPEFGVSEGLEPGLIALGVLFGGRLAWIWSGVGSFIVRFHGLENLLLGHFSDGLDEPGRLGVDSLLFAGNAA